jgi:hypothetical protein
MKTIGKKDSFSLEDKGPGSEYGRGFGEGRTGKAKKELGSSSSSLGNYFQQAGRLKRLRKTRTGAE